MHWLRMLRFRWRWWWFQRGGKQYSLNEWFRRELVAHTERAGRATRCLAHPRVVRALEDELSDMQRFIFVFVDGFYLDGVAVTGDDRLPDAEPYFYFDAVREERHAG